MTAIDAKVEVNQENLLERLQNAGDMLKSEDCELLLDFSSVRRIDSDALQMMEGLTTLAEAKSVKLVLRGVNVDVYKVLKLVKLSSRLSFVQ